jgi:hypothetical protein
MGRTFQEFMILCEASDPDTAKQLGWGGGASVTRTGDGGRIGRERKKSTPETRRMKAVGAGKMAPVTYKTRKDVGQQRGSTAPAPGRPKGGTTLEPGTAGTKGSAAMTAKERQRKAYLERKAKESGAKQPETASQAISQTKSAAPKPAAAKEKKPPSGKTRAERDKERNTALRAKYNAEKQKVLAGYKEVHGKLPTGKERTKLLAAVQKAHPPHPSGTIK